MKSSPYKNVKDVRLVAQTAFRAVTAEQVRNCYDHVEEQEGYYKLLHNMEPLPVEEIETVPEDIPISFEPVEPAENALVVDDNGHVLVPLEADIEVIEESPEICELLTCSLCDYKTQSNTSLNRHLKSIYECEECGEKFHGEKGKRSYTRHLKSHQPKTSKPQKIQSLNPPGRPRVQKSDDSFMCTECGKVFKFASHLNRHMISHKNKKRKLDFQLEKKSPAPVTPVITNVQPVDLIENSAPDLIENPAPEKPPVSPENPPKKQKRKQTIIERNVF